MNRQQDDRQKERTSNLSHFFVEQHGIAWLLMALTLLWGIYGYFSMPQRKDPVTPVREALVAAAWPGAAADQVEELLTKRIEAVVAQNAMVTEVTSTSRPGMAVVHLTLDENHVRDTAKEFDDIGVKLGQIGELPQGAGPVQYFKDFGSTAALMLTVASPTASSAEISLRASRLLPVLRSARAQDGSNVSLVFCYPYGTDSTDLHEAVQLLSQDLARRGILNSPRIVRAEDAFVLDGVSSRSDAAIEQAQHDFAQTQVGAEELHPDIWPTVLVRDPSELQRRWEAVHPQKYSYHELDMYTDRILRSLQQVEEATRLDRTGVLPEQIHLNYDPSRLASAHVNPFSLPELLKDHNTLAGTWMRPAAPGSERTAHCKA